MSMRSLPAFRTFSLLAALAFTSGCATVPRGAGFPDVAQTVTERLDARVPWYQGTPEDAEVAEAVRALLAEELTADAAVQIALLRNPKLQAEYEDLGIAQADLVQAGLLHNPTFFASFRFPDKKGGGEPEVRSVGDRIEIVDLPQDFGTGTNAELELALNFLDVLIRPLRKKIEAANFERTKLRVTHVVLEFAARVRTAYYELVGDAQRLELLLTVSDAAEAAAEFAIRQYDAGNLSRLEQTGHQAFYAQTLREAARIETQLALDRERLNALMGLWGAETAWRLPNRLPEIPDEDALPDDVESLAIRQRLDLAVAMGEINAVNYARVMARKFRYIGLLDIGVSTERETEGQYVTGPSLQIELPIFDQGQARVARIESELRRAERDVEALAIHVRAEVRAARQKLASARESVEFYRRVILPLHETIVHEAQLHQNAMLIGLYDLLFVKQNQVNAAREYIESLRDYWVARTELARAVGGRLPVGSDRVQREVEPGQSQPVTPHEHVH